MRITQPHFRATAITPLVMCLLVGVAVLLPVRDAMAAVTVTIEVIPPLATTNSQRYIYITASWPESAGEVLDSVTWSGAAGTAPSYSGTLGNVYPNAGQDHVTWYRRSSGWFEGIVGPLCGRSNVFGQRPADYSGNPDPMLAGTFGYLSSPGGSILRQDNAQVYTVRADARSHNGTTNYSDSATNTYQTVSDNDDTLEWYVADQNGQTIDPMKVGPVEVVPDTGSGSDTYTFRVKYRSGLYSGLELPPRFNWSYSKSLWGVSNSLYWQSTDTWLDQTGYARDYGNDRGSYTPRVLLVIDGQHWAPHYMVPETGGSYAEGVTFRYTVLPTDYQNFLDNLFLLPFDLPGSDTWDAWAVNVTGRPTSNNYVSFAAGKHTYEFWTTDDTMPVANRSWVQVGWPGNDVHTEYMDRALPGENLRQGPTAPIWIRSAADRKRVSVYNEQHAAGDYTVAQMRRFADASVDSPDPYGYSYKSHEASTDADVSDPTDYANPSFRRFPAVNPVLTAYPFFGVNGREGGISTDIPSASPWWKPDFTSAASSAYYRGFIENDIPNNTQIQLARIGAVGAVSSNGNYYGLPFPPEIGAGPDPTYGANPGPWKVTNDDTILPNFANTWNEISSTPFRGGKWGQSSTYTVRVNYWQSENVPPRYMRVWIRKAGATPGNWQAYTMQKFDPADNDYTNGCTYQYQFSADQLPGGGGVGDYNYYFQSSDGTREAIYPQRPDRAGAIQDPGDIGVAPADSGSSHYWFRVNSKPALSAQSVTPVSGRTTEAFVFQVKYSDADGAAEPAGSGVGDRPYKARVYVDLYGDQFGQHTVSANPTDNVTLNYSVAPGTHTAAEMTNLFVVMQSGAATGKSYRIANNTASTITLVQHIANVADDGIGTPLDDGVKSGDKFYVAERADMTKSGDAALNPDPNNYKNGVVYEFNTATHMVLTPGVHKYFFEFADDWGSWQPDPTLADQTVEGEYVRYPSSGHFQGPEVIQNTAPVLSDYRFTPSATGVGPDGVTVTPFTFYVTYTDAQNDPPAFIRLGIDGTTDSPAQIVDLYPANASDTVYTDGAIYQSTPMLLAQGTHVIRAQASDGQDRFPAYFNPPATPPFKGPMGKVAAAPSGATLKYALEGATTQFPDHRLQGLGVKIQFWQYSASIWSVLHEYTVEDNVGDTLTLAAGSDPAADGVVLNDQFIFDAAPAPIVAANSAPTLDAPAATRLSPTEGRQTTTFTYKVTYYDNDQFAGVRGNPPKYVQVFIDNQPHDMTAVDPTDKDYTTAGGGAEYEFQITGLTQATAHTFYFVASDGEGLARIPTTSGDFYTGPQVIEPPAAPSNLVVTDTPADNGGSLNYQFSASLDDGGGANNVVQYLVFRNTTGAPFVEDATTHDLARVITATKAPSYSGIFAPVPSGVNYYVTVRAYNGSTPIAVNPDGTPQRNADGTLVTAINPDRISGDSNVEGPVAAVDNVPPQAPTNLVATDPGLGGTVDLSWDRSPDDGTGQNDVKGYNVYRNTTGSPFTTAAVAQIPATGAGSYTYRDQNGVLDDVTYYYVVRAYDDTAGLHESPDSNVASSKSTDTNGPEIQNLVPADGATNVAPGASITFDVVDTGAGPDINSITVGIAVNGTPVVGGALNKSFDPTNAKKIHVVYQPPSALPMLATVDVHIAAADTAVPTPNPTTSDTSFTVAGPPIYSISGKVLDKNGLPLPILPTPVRVTAGAYTVDVAADGTYTIPNLSGGTYTVTPVLTGYAFTPESKSVTLGPSATGVDFVAEAAYNLTGKVLDLGGQALPGVLVSDGVHEATTDSTGSYQISGLKAGDYQFTATKAGYTFTPAVANISLPATPNPPGDAVANFQGDVLRYGISGIIKLPSGARVSGVYLEAHEGSLTGPVVGSATTNASGAYTIAGLPTGAYVVVPGLVGWSFEPASRTVNLSADTTGIDFTGLTLYSYTLPSGLRMVAFPIVARELNPALNVPAGVDVARWDPTAGGVDKYIRGNPGLPLPTQYQLLPGRGFWMRNNSAANVFLNIPGEPVDTTAVFYLQVESGWSMAGNPFTSVLPWSNLNITSGGTVRDYGFLYNTSTGSYELVTDMLALGAKTSIPANAGFWMKSTGKLSVAIAPVTTAAVGAEAAAPTLQAGDYLVPVQVTAEGRADTASIAGVLQSLDADLEIANPPAVSPYVDLYFVSNDGERLACDVRSAAAGAQSWNFVVTTDLSGSQVALSLPDLSRIPADKTVTLVDEATGKRIYARTMNQYVYTADETGARRFRLEIAPRNDAGLTVSAASARQTGAGAVVTYSLSKPASVEVSVMNISGRPIRTLASSGVAPSGASQMVWNLQAANGTKVPSGRYLVKITAQSEDGQSTQTLVTLQVAR